MSELATAPVALAAVQFKPVKGNLAANIAELGAIFAQLTSAERVPRLIVLPEACLTGYFLEGAVYELALTAPAFARTLHAAWITAGAAVPPVDVVCGFYENDGGTFYNSAMYVRLSAAEPAIVHVHRKMFLPTYGVFDEERFLSRGRGLHVFPSAFGPAAILLCEDAWHAIMPTVAALKGARVIFIPSASPGRGLAGQGELESVSRWKSLMRAYASEHGVYIVYAGLTGFEGGKGLAGSTCVVAPSGGFVVEAPALDACIVRAVLDPLEVEVARATLPLLGDLAGVLPDLWYDPEIPLPKRTAEA